MQNDSSASLANLQLAVGRLIPCRVAGFEIDKYALGAAYNIFNDLTALTEYITENTEPGPGPLLNLKENELLEMWSDLAVEGMTKSFCLSLFTDADLISHMQSKSSRNHISG